MLSFLSIFASLLFLLYVFLTWHYNYWTKRGVPGPKPWPLLGSLKNEFLRQRNVAYDVQDIYRKYKGTTPFVGIFQMRKPNLLILDQELLRDIMVRNFKNFQNNGFSSVIDKETDPILGRNPFVLENEEWKTKRAEITPAFTPSRIKALFPLIDDVSGKMTKYIHKQLQKSQKTFDAHELCSKFTIDAVSNCIFAVDAESFTKENTEIREKAMMFIDFPISVILSIILYATFPFMRKIIKIPFVKKDIEKFFVDMMEQALKHREESKFERDDYLGFLISLRKKKQFESIDMAAHAVTFFTDGFATSSVAITNTLYEISKNKRVQEKLRQEIKDSVAVNGGVSFDSINNMVYLDQVFNEALRINTPIAFTMRVCNEDIEVEGIKGKKLLIEKGLPIYIPVLQIHLDPENYENPETFNPERFDDGRIKDFKDKSIFLPFGDGPRICLGMRFAITQSKAAIVEILRNFDITVSNKMQKIPIIDPKAILNMKVGGTWIDFRPIDKI